MTTLCGESHEHREIADSFGANAERYDRARPRYPDALVQRIAADARDALDVGCGTGIVARQLRAAGCRVLGIEPDERMAELARRHGVEVEVGAFEDWDPAGRAFDAVVCGQAWHWIDPAVGAAKAREALRPGGRLAVFWNAGQAPAELASGFADVYRRLAPDAIAGRAWTLPGGDAYAALCAKAAEAIHRAGGFADPEQWRFAWDRSYTRDEWLEVVSTHGDHNALSPDRLRHVLGGIASAVDAVGGSFTMRYTTVVVTAQRPRQDSNLRPAA